MMKQRLIIFLLGFYLVPVITAQTPPDNLPDPNTIFAPASIQAITIHPVINHTDHTLSFYHDQAWLTFPNPDDITHNFSSIVPYPDGTYLFQNLQTQQVWQVDLETQTITPINTPCGADWLIFDWVYATLDDTTLLCHQVTGQTSPPLPQQLNPSTDDALNINQLVWGSPEFFSISTPKLSPTGDYLALIASSEHIAIFSYHIETETLMLMGIINPWADTIRMNWLTPTQLMIDAGRLGTWTANHSYIADITQNTVKPIHSTVLNAIQPVAEPFGFIKSPHIITATTAQSVPFGICQIEFYDVATDRLTTYDMGSLCEVGVEITDGSGDFLYRSMFPTALVRYNFHTGARAHLYVGEIEALGTVSPDGHHALIALDDNGHIDSYQQTYLERIETFTPTSYHVFNLNTQTFIGEVSGLTNWLGSSHLYAPTHHYTLTDDGQIITQPLFGEVILAHPDTLSLFIRQADQFNRLDLSNQTLTPIGTLPAGYNRVMFHQQSSDLIRINLYGDDQPTLTFDWVYP